MAFRPPSVPLRQKRGFGCASCGCALIIILVLLFIAIGYGLYHVALTLTDTTATPVATVDAGPAVYEEADHKIAAFQQALERGQPASLHLSSDEINTFIAHDPSMAQVRGHLAVQLQGNEATVRSSVPLGVFESRVLPERFANGQATFSINYDADARSILIDLHSLTVKDQRLPPDSNASVAQLINAAIAKQTHGGPIRDCLSRTQKIAIENGQLVIEIK